MNILHISYTDIPGKRFNGYDLCVGLNRIHQNSYFYSWEKYSHNSFSFEYGKSKIKYVVSKIIVLLEKQSSLQSIFAPINTLSFLLSSEFRNSDVVHLHIVYPHFFNLFSIFIIQLFKPLVWTWHDMWPMTGHCVHSFSCDRWKNICDNCPNISALYPMKKDRTKIMYKLKKFVYSISKYSIVVSSKWMKEVIIQSPLAKNHPINLIPFGIDTQIFSKKDRITSRNNLRIKTNNFVVGLRANTSEFKGHDQVVKLLNTINLANITLVLFDKKCVYDQFSSKFQIINVGWIDNEEELSTIYTACDIFLSLSSAETFGMMIVEAMACSLPVVLFDGTASSEIVHSEMNSSFIVAAGDINGLIDKITLLYRNKKLLATMSKNARNVVLKYYDFNQYLKSHINLYNSLCRKV